MRQRKGTGQISRENEALDAEVMAQELGKQAAPGVYLSGQKLLATKCYRDVARGEDVLLLVFEGDWSLRLSTLMGLDVQIVENSKTLHDPAAPAGGEILDAEVIEEAEWKEIER